MSFLQPSCPASLRQTFRSSISRRICVWPSTWLTWSTNPSMLARQQMRYAALIGWMLTNENTPGSKMQQMSDPIDLTINMNLYQNEEKTHKISQYRSRINHKTRTQLFPSMKMLQCGCLALNIPLTFQNVQVSC